MKRVPWSEQLKVPGRVFELRSTSKRYPPPCALIVRPEQPYSGYPQAVGVDRIGCIGDGLYQRSHNPDIYIPGFRGADLAKRIVRRRFDLERFDRDDLALIRYGCAVDFDGRIHGRSTASSIPSVVPSRWSIFWLPAYVGDDHFWPSTSKSDEIRTALRGAWHFDNYGGARGLGYKYGHMWATRHGGQRLNEIRKLLRSLRPDVIEQQSTIIRFRVEDFIVTFEQRKVRDCPPLGSGWYWAKNTVTGNWQGGTMF